MVDACGDCDYRRGMQVRGRSLFAGGGIQLPGVKVTTLTILGAFAAGVLIGWLTTLIPGFVQASTLPTASPSPSPSATLDTDVSVPPLAPILRDYNDDDGDAGLLSLDYPYQGDGTFSVVGGGTEPDPLGPSVRWISIEVEDGINVEGSRFAGFVMDTLNDPRGWGANNPLQYARTDGVADYRIVIASPYTAAAVCPHPHEAAPERVVIEGEEPSPGPSVMAEPSPSMGEQEQTCAERSLTVISVYDWAAGVEAFGDEYQQSRRYQVLHGVGHLMGFEDEECTGGPASVMTHQSALPEDCTANPWPYPDAAVPSATPDPSG